VQDIDGSKQKEFMLAAERGAIFRLMTLSKDSVRTDGIDEKGETPLIKALNNGHADCAIYLLGQDASVRRRDRHGRWALEALALLCPAVAKSSNTPLPLTALNLPPELREKTKKLDDETQNDISQENYKFSFECHLLKQAYLSVIRSTDYFALREMFEHLRLDIMDLDEALEAAKALSPYHLKRYVETFELILHQKWELKSPRTWRNVAELYCELSGSAHVDENISKIVDKLMEWLTKPEHFKSAFDPPHDDALTYTLKQFVQAGIPSRDVYEALAVRLLNRGINPNGTSSEGETPLTQISKTDSTYLARVLFEAGANLDAKKDGGMTPLMIACSEGNLEMAKFLISAGATLDSKNYDAMTPLMIASSKGHFEIAKALIEAGANVHSVNNNGTNALIWSAASGDAHIMTLLLENGADLNSTNKHGVAAIHAAVENLSENGVKQALAAGQDPNFPDADGNTPLHLAAANADVKIMQLLVDAGADISRLNGSQEAPMDVAVKNDSGAAISLLQSVIEKNELAGLLEQDGENGNKERKSKSL